VGEVIAVEQLVAGLAVPLAWLLMWRGWRARVRAQSDLPAPAEPPEEAGGDGQPVEGVWVSTTYAGQPFQRVVAHGLGARSPVRAEVGADGVALRRRGARSVLVPPEELLGVRRQRGMVGKFVVEEEGLVVMTWRLGAVELDTGIRCRRRADADRLAGDLGGLLEGAR
jgi:hypothetical protein